MTSPQIINVAKALLTQILIAHSLKSEKIVNQRDTDPETVVMS
jgi:hypothetical protein